jgi:ribosomal protein S18 acetylase RimI-like enzyme
MHGREHPEIFKTFDAAPVAAFFRARLDEPSVVILVAHLNQDDGPVGYLMAEAVTQAETAFTRPHRMLHVQHVVVADAHGRQGVGTALMDRVVREADRLDCDDLQLVCWSFNVDGQAFFASQGFRPVQVRMSMPTPRSGYGSVSG